MGGETWCKITDEVFAKETNSKAFDAIKKYSDLRQQVLAIPREDLISDKELVIESLSGKAAEETKTAAQSDPAEPETWVARAEKASADYPQPSRTP